MAAYPGAAIDLQVQPNGTIRDAVTGTLATITRAGSKYGINPTTGLLDGVGANLLYPEKYPNGGGYWAAIEEARTNDLPYSFFPDSATVAFWSKGSLTVSLGANALYGKEVTLTAGASDAVFYRPTTGAVSATRTLSCYVRLPSGSAPTSADCALDFSGSAQAGTLFTAVPGTPWYRMSFTSVCTLSNLYAGVAVKALRSVIICCLQAEVGAFSTSYIPTTVAAITRPTDVVKYPGVTIAGFASLTVAAISQLTPSTYGGHFEWAGTSGKALNVVSLARQSTGYWAWARCNASAYLASSTPSVGITPNAAHSFVGRWVAGGAITLFIDGAAKTSSASPFSKPNGLASDFLVGSTSDSLQGSVPFHRLVAFPTALSDAEVATLSTKMLAGVTQGNPFYYAQMMGA